MFGFQGKYFSNIDYTTYGEMQGTNPAFNRRIAFGAGNIINAGDGLASLGMAGVTGYFEYDIDGVSGSLPATTNIEDPKLAATSYVAGEHKVNLLAAKTVNINQTSVLVSPTVQLRMERALNSPFIYYEFAVNGSTALTPATRRMNVRIFQPDAIGYLCFSQYSNQPNATRNIVHALKDNILDLRHFTNLDTLTFGIGVVWDSSPLTVRFPEYLRVVHFSPRMPSAIIGKLPKSVEYFEGFTNCGGSVSLNGFFDDAENMISLYLSRIANQTQWPSTSTINLITGSLDISHMSNLKEFTLSNNSVMTGLTLPTKTDWEHILIHTISSTAANSIDASIIENLFDSPNLVSFIFYNSSYSITRNINNEDISDDLVWFWNYGNNWTGDITITDAKPTLKEFKVGGTSSESNVFPNINLTGLSGGSLTTLHLQGVQCENLLLPASLPNITDITLYDNKLSISTNSDLITKINGYTSLVNVHLSTTGSFATTRFGQDSVDGLGSNPDLSGLVNMTQLNIALCKITGSLTVPNLNKLMFIDVSHNTGLTSITNFTSHTTLQTLRAVGCHSLNLEVTPAFTRVFVFQISDVNFVEFNLTGRTASDQISSFQLERCSFSGGTAIFPSVTDKFRLGNGVPMIIMDSPTLTNIQNLEFVTFANYTTGSNIFSMTGNALDITFPFGANSFIPKSISIQNNGMSVANVDATINNIYTERAKWSTYTGVGEVLNISGSNASPTGIYQAPAGFSLGVSDGTPASAKEQAYVLVNNYGWTITMN